jgi:hypothetical protein
MPTPDIFDFDTEQLAAYDQNKIDALLRTEPALYLNHLRIAQHLDGWAADLDEDEGDQHYARALREVAAHLRQGNYTTDGILARSGV